MHQRNNVPLPLIAIFVIFSGALIAMRGLLARHSLDYNVLAIANIIFFAISIITFFLQKKALANSNPNVFVRSVMGGMLLKMFVCISAVIVYRLAVGNTVSKPSVFAAMFLYLLYLAVEVAGIIKLNRGNNA